MIGSSNYSSVVNVTADEEGALFFILGSFSFDKFYFVAVFWRFLRQLINWLIKLVYIYIYIYIYDFHIFTVI